jgi:hypothetical protein
VPRDPAPEPADYDARCDVLVIGGGLAGVCAAIAAARHGCSVALVQDRPVLGGNSSSEVRVNTGGADHGGARRHARETGIIEALRLTDRVRNHEPVANGRINFVWDHVLLDAVWAEPRITLYLNTSATRALMSELGTIEGVEAYQSSLYQTLRLQADVVIDASGDGVVAADAGADFRIGREGRAEFNEPLAAPEEPDDCTLGSSILFRARDVGCPVPFVAPGWAHRFEPDDLPHRSLAGFAHAGFWWIEYGGILDTIGDSEAIRDRLLAYVLGVWDLIKNRSDLDADHYVLDWVGAVPGKRESRRFLGDTILIESDLLDPGPCPDAVAYGGWPIDLHPPEGIRGVDPPARFIEVPHVYPIPLSCLYSRNIGNLLFAGRNISASHAAFGSTRLMATGAVMGQAVGTAAALCVQHGVDPRTLAQEHIQQLQQALLRDDATIPGVRNEDPLDLALPAQATATSDSELRIETGRESLGLDAARAQLFPVTEGRVDAVDVLVHSSLDHGVMLGASLLPAAGLEDFTCTEPIATARADVPAGLRGWVTFEFGAAVEPRSLCFVSVGAAPGVAWLASQSEPPGTQRAVRAPDDSWRYLGQRGTHCLLLRPASRPFGPDNVVNGFARPEAWPNLWVSDPSQPLPQSLTLEFPEPQVVDTVYLSFDTNLNRLVEFGPVPECARDYVLWAEVGGAWQEVARTTDNFLRRRVHAFDAVRATRIRLDVLATNGDESARVYEIRVYGVGSPARETEGLVAAVEAPVEVVGPA